MARPRVIVTRRWPDKVEQALQQRYRVELNETDAALDPKALRSAFQSADAVCPTVTDRVDADVISDSSAKIIANYGVGFGHIDTDAARSEGMIVTNTPDVLTDCTADLALMLMLMTARRAGEGERELRNGQWQGWRPTHLVGTRLSGKRLGVVGFGRIGRAVAERAYRGFGMEVLCYNRSAVPRDALAPSDATATDDIETLFSESDFISIHCPGGADNAGLVGERLISRMQSHAILINTARGEVVDERALAAALKAGRIAAAGLDVYQYEPDVPAALIALNNVVLLPHLGSATVETREAMGFRVVENLDAFFAGKEPPDRVV